MKMNFLFTCLAKTKTKKNCKQQKYSKEEDGNCKSIDEFNIYNANRSK